MRSHASSIRGILFVAGIGAGFLPSTAGPAPTGGHQGERHAGLRSVGDLAGLEGGRPSVDRTSATGDGFGACTEDDVRPCGAARSSTRGGAGTVSRGTIVVDPREALVAGLGTLGSIARLETTGVGAGPAPRVLERTIEGTGTLVFPVDPLGESYTVSIDGMVCAAATREGLEWRIGRDELPVAGLSCRVGFDPEAVFGSTSPASGRGVADAVDGEPIDGAVVMLIAPDDV